MNNTKQQLTETLNNIFIKVNELKIDSNNLDEIKQKITDLYGELESIDEPEQTYEFIEVTNRVIYNLCYIILNKLEEKIKEIEKGKLIIIGILNKYKEEKFNFVYKSYDDQRKFIFDKYEEIHNQELINIISNLNIDINKLDCINNYNNKYNKIFIKIFKELKNNYNFGLNKLNIYYNDNK